MICMLLSAVPKWYILLTADVSRYFRNMSLEIYCVDSDHFFSATGLAW